jgi:hypothetical protein
MNHREISHSRSTCKPVGLGNAGYSKSFWQKTTFWIALVCALAFVAMSGTACKSKSGSREFIPGKGWIEN